MELYSISSAYPYVYDRVVVIDNFISAIWTERFIEAGEVEIVLPAAHEHLKLLAPGNLLGCQGSREIMLLETRSIEDGLVKATGKTLETYFNERYLPDDSILGEMIMSAKGGDILKGIVNYMQNWPNTAANEFGSFSNFYLQSTPINNLETAGPDSNETGPIRTEKIPSGPVYDTLLSLAKKYRIGQSVVWTRMTPDDRYYDSDPAWGTHKFVYTTRQGKDLTNSVRFSSDLDNLGAPKQLLSIAGSKNYVTIIPPKWIFSTMINVTSFRDPFNWVMWNVPDDEPFSQFRRRFMTIDCTDLTLDKLGGPADPKTASTADYYPAIQKMFDIMRARQEEALNEHKRTKIIDGEITPESQYVYKHDYDLGDTVLVQGDFGDPLRGVITEYTRTQDETGERQYPTMSTDPEVITGASTPKNPDGETGV